MNVNIANQIALLILKPVYPPPVWCCDQDVPGTPLVWCYCDQGARGPPWLPLCHPSS